MRTSSPGARARGSHLRRDGGADREEGHRRDRVRHRQAASSRTSRSRARCSRDHRRLRHAGARRVALRRPALPAGGPAQGRHPRRSDARRPSASRRRRRVGRSRSTPPSSSVPESCRRTPERARGTGGAATGRRRRCHAPHGRAPTSSPTPTSATPIASSPIVDRLPEMTARIAPRTGKRTILIVDDEADIRKLLRRVSRIAATACSRPIAATPRSACSRSSRRI